MNANVGNNQNKLLNQLNKLQEENNKLKSLCIEYQTILKSINQKVLTWDVINDIYSIYITSDDSYSYNFDGDRFSIESWKKAIHPEDVDRALEKLEKVLDEKHESYENMYRIQTNDGSYRWVQSKGKAIKDHQGNIIKIIPKLQ